MAVVPNNPQHQMMMQLHEHKPQIPHPVKLLSTLFLLLLSFKRLKRFWIELKELFTCCINSGIFMYLYKINNNQLIYVYASCSGKKIPVIDMGNCSSIIGAAVLSFPALKFQNRAIR